MYERGRVSENGSKWLMNIGPGVDINATEIAKSTEKAAVAAVLVHPQHSNPLSLFQNSLTQTRQAVIGKEIMRVILLTKRTLFNEKRYRKDRLKMISISGQQLQQSQYQ